LVGAETILSSHHFSCEIDTDVIVAAAAASGEITSLGAAHRNPNLIGLGCIRCDFQSEQLDFPSGCPKCAAEGHASNLSCLYSTVGSSNTELPLPYTAVPYLGQGNTPLAPLSPLQKFRQSNIRPAMFKMECANPTGSHKDRMAAVGVAHARAQGKTMVIAASSGNAGVAIAAFSAAAGLRCEIAVTPACSPLYRALIARHGAVVTECTSSLARWNYVADRCRDPALYSLTNYALPAVGSPAVAIEGYKPIAQELVHDLEGAVISEIFVPVARGDLLWGLYLGFKHMLDQGLVKAMPALVAVEPFPRLAQVLAGADYRTQFEGTTLQLSTAGSTVTLQALEAVRRSNGRVQVVADAAALSARDELAAAGFSFELCAAAAYVAYRTCAQTAANSASGASIIIATAHGSRDALTT
jgi:threonine synthase